MQTEEKLIAPHVGALTMNQYSITTSLGEWFQSYETTIAFKGEFGILIDKEWYEETPRSRTTTKWLCSWLSQYHPPFYSKDLHQRVKSEEFKLIFLNNYIDHPTPTWPLPDAAGDEDAGLNKGLTLLRASHKTRHPTPKTQHPTCNT